MGCKDAVVSHEVKHEVVSSEYAKSRDRTSVGEREFLEGGKGMNLKTIFLFHEVALSQTCLRLKRRRTITLPHHGQPRHSLHDYLRTY
jgi:hypothetical protein